MSETTIPQTFSRYPLLWIAVYFTFGIFLARCLSIDLLASILTAVLAGALCVVWRRSAVLFIPIIFLSLGTLCYHMERDRVARNQIKRIYDEGRIISGEPVEIDGVLSAVPEPAYGGVYLTLRSERLRFKNAENDVSGDIRLFFPVDAPAGSNEFDSLDLRYGSRLRVFCRLEREERFQNPGVRSRIETLDQQGIDATAIVKSSFLIEKLGEEPVFISLAWVYEQRQRLIFEFRRHFSAPTAGVMIASLLGDQHFLDRETSEVFRDGGTFHVLVISGLHITFIGGLTVWLVSYFVRRRILRFIFPSIFLWAFTFAVGAEVPVVRASIMFTILLFARVVYREASQLNSLGLCCLLLLVWRPADLFSPSFQLTVVSVGAIVGCSFPLIEKLRLIGRWMPTATHPLPPRASKWLRKFCESLYWNEASWDIEKSRHIWSANLYKTTKSAWLRSPNLQSIIAYVFEGLTVSAIVQSWMLPIVVIYFHRVSLVSVVLNLWVGVFLALESFSSLFAVLIAGGSDWLAAPLVRLTEVCNALMMSLPAWFSQNHLASFRLPAYAGSLRIVYVLFGIAVVGTSVGVFRWNPFDLTPHSQLYRRLVFTAMFAAAVLAIVIVCHPFSAPKPDGRLTVEFLDVGQGDSALITFPNGATMLVDGGGQVDYRSDDSDFEPDIRRIGESVVSEFLWEKGYSQIDYLVATHADVDHIQGLSDVARNFDVGKVFVGVVPIDDPDFDELMRVVESRKIPVGSVHTGYELQIGGSRVTILNPSDEPSHPTSPNNASVVMKISYGDRSFLFTGDIERETEAELASSTGQDLHADVVKIAHHGSRTSSTQAFVKMVGAGIAVVSVGRRSRFGHPHAEVVARWKESGADVMKTGDKGTVTISTDGRDLQMRTFAP